MSEAHDYFNFVDIRKLGAALVVMRHLIANA